jgi:hypothetical protein
MIVMKNTKHDAFCLCDDCCYTDEEIARGQHLIDHPHLRNTWMEEEPCEGDYPPDIEYE